MKSKKKAKKTTQFSKNNLYDELLNNINAVKTELAECFIEGGLESFKEILSAYVDAQNKSKLSNETQVSSDTVYRIIKKKNITIDSAFKIFDIAS